MARPIKDNRNIIQSYILTAARYEMSVYEKRIMYNIVDVASQELQGLLPNGKIKSVIGTQIQPTLNGKRIIIPVKNILASEKDNNYTAAKKAFRSLATKGIEYEDNNGWKFTNIISNPSIDKTGGLASFDVHNDIWACAWNFAKGYRKLEFNTVTQFRSVFSMRFYELMSGQKKPLSFSMDELRNMFCIENKFKRIEHFERKVLDVAMTELNEHSPYSFTYERNTIPSRGRTGEKVVGYTFHPHFIHKNKELEVERKELMAQIPITSLIPGDVYEYLLNKGLTKEQLSANKDTIHEFCKVSPDVLGQIAIAWGRARGAQNQIGYFINTIKGMTKDAQKKT